MFRYGFGIIHGVVRLRHDAGTVGSPEIGPYEKRLILILCLLNQAVGFLGHKILNGALQRSLVLAEHLLHLESRIISHKSVGDIHIRKSLFLQIFLIVIGRIIRRLIETQVRKNTASREPISHKSFAVLTESAFLRLTGRRHMPFSCIAAVIPCIPHTLAQKGRPFFDIGEIIDHPVAVGIQPRHDTGPGRRADGGRGKGIAKLHPFLCQFINMRRFTDIIASIGADRIPSLLIR